MIPHPYRKKKQTKKSPSSSIPIIFFFAVFRGTKTTQQNVHCVTAMWIKTGYVTYL
jgi:hypothetical protein